METFEKYIKDIDTEEIENREKERLEEIKQKAQAEAIVEKASKSPHALVKMNISQKAINMINDEEDVEIKEKMSKASRDVVHSAIQSTDGDSKKISNEGYFKGHEDAVMSMGGNKDMPTHKQKFLNALFNGWWYVLMATFGLLVLAPLKVMLNMAYALSPERRTIITKGEEKTTTSERKMHWLPCTVAIVFFVVYLSLLVTAIVMMCKLIFGI